MLDALPAIPQGSRPVPSFAGVCINPMPRCSMYASMLSQVSLASSVGGLEGEGPRIEVPPPFSYSVFIPTLHTSQFSQVVREQSKLVCLLARSSFVRSGSTSAFGHPYTTNPLLAVLVFQYSPCQEPAGGQLLLKVVATCPSTSIHLFNLEGCKCGLDSGTALVGAN